MDINDLVRNAKKGNVFAKEEIVINSDRFIKKVIRDTLPSFYYANICYDDLYQEACIGILIAIKDFDFNKEASFYTYAYAVVKGYLLRTLVNNGRFIRIPHDTYWLLVKYVSTKRRLASLLEREPSVEELAKEMNLSNKKIIMLDKYVDDVISTEIVNLERLNCSQVIDECDLFRMVLNEELAEKIDDIFRRLNISNRDVEIIKLRYGFYDRIYSLSEIGRRFNISHQRVDEIINRVIEKIKLTKCAEELAEFTDNYDNNMRNINVYRNKNKNKRKVLLK